MKKLNTLLSILMVSSLLLTSCNKGFSSLEPESQTKAFGVEFPDRTPSDQLLLKLNNAIDSSTKTKTTPNNKNLKLYIDGPEAYPALEEMILSAKKSVYVEVFEFHNDPTGQKIADAMVKKAKEGLDVKFIYDFIGNTNIKLMTYMAKNGVDVKTYGKQNFSLNATVTHRKIYIVDGIRAMTGGMNIDKNFASSGLFHDILMSYEGDTVKQTMDEFFIDWEMAGGKITAGMESIYEEPVPVNDGEKVYNVRLAVTNPLKTKKFQKREDLYGMLLAVLDNAKYSINIAMPYFTEDNFVEHIIKAKNRGVKVKILIPYKTNIAIVTMANKMTINQLTKAGVEVYTGGKKDNSFNHSKVITVDDVWTTIGSCNADSRSFHNNQELNLAISDVDFTKEVNTRFFDRFIGEASKAEYENIPWYKKPVYNLVERFDSLL
ncbi:MAG: phosphatidylserine/phosphatidylglycerophosphate/cardiolipin synthase family protein [Cyanobacteriota bacterium]